MPSLHTPCVRCNESFPVSIGPDGNKEYHCPECGTVQTQYIYPAYCREKEAVYRGIVAEDGATCFYHDTVAAAVVCDDCGRYTCELCALIVPRPPSNPPDFPHHLCPACFARQVEGASMSDQGNLFQTTYPRPDIVALLLALVPLIIFPLFLLTPVTAPLTLFLLFRYGRHTRTPLGRYRLNYIAALIVVIITGVLWGGLIVAVLSTIFEGGF